MRLRLVPPQTNWDFFRSTRLSFGVSLIAILLSLIAFLFWGLNFGIDFRGGTSLRTNGSQPVQIETYRSALNTLELGDISITQIYDPAAPNKYATQIRIGTQENTESIAAETIKSVTKALQTIDPKLTIASVESVGPKVSAELIKTAILAVFLAIAAVLFYIWLRFEWQFSLGAVAALIHDITLTIGIFSALQIKFDLAIIAALLTIVGYSLNDTVVVFDRVRENLRKYKSGPLRNVLNRAINETLSRTMMTSFTTLLALLSLFVLGGDIIRGFVFAMIWGVIVGTYSSIFIASAILLRLGVVRNAPAAKD